MTRLQRAAVSTLLAFLAVMAMDHPLAAGEAKRVNVGSDNIAIKGYDTVAYFTEGRPMKGNPELTFSWSGAQWRFADPAHRDMFAASPERYAPQFGGFCSMALAHGQIASIDPEVWTIVDGKLYLNLNKSVGEKFRQNVRKNIDKAEANWRKVNE